MAIINGNNTIFATLNGNQFFIDSTLNAEAPVYGYAYTQAAYDLITPDEALYYVIYSTANGEAIHATLELSQADYDAMSSHVADTLYIIMDGTDIEDVRLGDTQADKLYLGSTALWPTAIPVPEWFTPEWYASAKTYLDSAFSFKPSDLYMDLIYDYYRLSDNRHVKGIARIYWWNNPAPAEPIKVFVDPQYVSNNNYWWTMQTATGANDYWYPGVFYQDGSSWTVKDAPNSQQAVNLRLVEYAYYVDFTPVRAPAMFYAGGTVTANITQPTT